MEKQIANSEAMGQLILQLAQDNANQDCRKVTEALPKDNPSLEETINGFAKVGTGSCNMGLLANSITAAVKPTPHCYKCGQGHSKVNCPHKSIPQRTFQGQRGVNTNCN